MYLALKRALLLIMMMTLPSFANDNPFESKLPFKSAIIHYLISGNQQGTQITYIRDYGKERVIYQNIHSKIMHQNRDHDTLIMITPKWTYHINLLTKEATKEPSLNYLLTQKFNQLSPKEQAKILARKTETFLKLPVISLSISGVHQRISKEGNLVLSSQTGIMGYKVKTVATDINITDVNHSLFVLPKDLKIVSKKADEKKAQEIIQALLKEPNHTSKNTKIDYQMIIQEGIQALDF